MKDIEIYQLKVMFSLCILVWNNFNGVSDYSKNFRNPRILITVSVLIFHLFYLERISLEDQETYLIMYSLNADSF